MTDVLHKPFGKRPEVGQHINHLTYLGLGRFTTRQMFAFRCDCGKYIEAELHTVRKGRVKSCGCFNHAKIGEFARKHGKSRSPEARIWAGMRNRCRNPNANGFNLYGGRGISVDPAWDTFEQFLADMGPRPSPRHSLDRIDNEKGYGPANCRWATQSQQCRNQRKTIKVTAFGKTQAIKDWAEELGIPSRRLSGRWENGWRGEELLTRPKNSRRIGVPSLEAAR